MFTSTSLSTLHFSRHVMRIVRVVGAALRMCGIAVFLWIFFGQSCKTLANALLETCKLVSNLGFIIINPAKSHPFLPQSPTFRGAKLDQLARLAHLTDERITNLHQCVELSLQVPEAPAPQAWLRMVGLMASMVDIMDFCRLQMQLFQLHLLFHAQSSPYRSHDTYLSMVRPPPLVVDTPPL